MKKCIFIVLAIPAIIFGNVPNEPKSIVTHAINSLMSGKIEQLLSITENSELRKTKELIDSINNKKHSKESLIAEYQLVESWNIEKSQEHEIKGRKVTIVSTIWKVKANVSQKSLPNQIEAKELKEIKSQTIRVDYMLEKFNNQWKIISQKTIS
ncbi:MAG: hypothetical protein ACRCTJ_04150 [Brevinema sp.]